MDEAIPKKEERLEKLKSSADNVNASPFAFAISQTQPVKKCPYGQKTFIFLGFSRFFYKMGIDKPVFLGYN